MQVLLDWDNKALRRRHPISATFAIAHEHLALGEEEQYIAFDLADIGFLHSLRVRANSAKHLINNLVAKLLGQRGRTKQQAVIDSAKNSVNDQIGISISHKRAAGFVLLDIGDCCSSPSPNMPIV